MSTIKSSAEHLTLNADGASKDIKFQANGVEKASIDSSGNLTVSGNLTSVGIDDNADATAITIDSSENVGIGTTSPTENLHIKEARSSGAGMVPLIKVQTTTNNATGDGSAIAFHGDYNSTEWGFGKIGGANSGANYGGALEFHTNAGNGSSASVAYTKQLTIMHDGRGVSQFTAKAWINMSDSATRDSHNISHTSDNGTGDFSCYFDADMANTNYVPLTGQEGGFDVCRFNTHHTSYVGEYRFQTGYQASNGALTKADVGSMFYAFFGD